MAWISVAYRLPALHEAYNGGPMESESVLVFGPFVTVGTLGETYKKRQLRWRTHYGVWNVTHWMPLPHPPARV